MIGWTRNMHGIDEKAYKTLFGKPEIKRPLANLRLLWEDNIRMDLREVGWEDVDWIHPSQDRVRDVVNTVMNLRVS
jgi:hypothetical protein